jgi:Ca2+-binding RTX toxin-like protein
MGTYNGGWGDEVIDLRAETEGFYIDGGQGRDIIHGTEFDDYIMGGWDLQEDSASWFPDWQTDGDDTVFGHGGNDVIHGWGDNDLFDGGAGDDYLTGDDGDDTLKGGVGQDFLAAATGSDIIEGGEGHDNLGGQAGDDLLYGGAGDDLLYSDEVGGLVDENGNHQPDTGNDLIDGGDGYDTAAFYNASRGVTVDLSITDAQDTGLGMDTLVDIEHLIGTYFSDVLTGDGGNNNLVGMDTATSEGTSDPIPQNDDTLSGGGGDDLLSVGTGSHILDGGTGKDTVSAEFAAAGVTVSLALLEASQDTGQGVWLIKNVENLSGSQHADVLAGNAQSNVLAGSHGADTLKGGAGKDTLLGDGSVSQDYSWGWNWFDYDSGQPWALSGEIKTAFTGFGEGNDVLDGGLGADLMVGGFGNDTYYIDDIGDKAIEYLLSGTDQVISSISHNLGWNFENLTLTGSAAVNGTGNNLTNKLVGNAGDNVLNGGSGADQMLGGLGSDTYVVDTTFDKVEEALGAGTDGVHASVTFTLGANIENLTLTGMAGINGTGNELDNVVTGNGAANELSGGGGNDTLNGGAGIDTMTGGLGDDIFIVDDSADVTVEAAGGGIDRVDTVVSYTLGAEVEDLRLTGAAAINGTGNALANVIGGNAAANILNGMAGADTMTGGAGNDIYHVDDAGDVASESGGSGSDKVESSVTYTIASGIEQLALTGTGAINGKGNSSGNILTGNSSANILDGAFGADQMFGGAGGDTYVVDNAGDVVTEMASSGTDTVQSSVSYVLGSYLEHLTLLGSGAINGTGNGGNNSITGNSGANSLSGGDGNDTVRGGSGADSIAGGVGADNLYGGIGNDVLAGWSGADNFHFDTALNGTTNVDTVSDFNAVEDTIVLDRTVFTGVSANGTLAASAFQSGTAAADAGDRIIYNQTTGKIFYDADGSGGIAAVLFAQVNAGTVLTNADFSAVA